MATCNICCEVNCIEQRLHENYIIMQTILELLIYLAAWCSGKAVYLELFISNPGRDLLACSIVPQPTPLPRAPAIKAAESK
jgi:hypothetical protein